jgi:cobalt transporter subunit CbtB
MTTHNPIQNSHDLTLTPAHTTKLTAQLSAIAVMAIGAAMVFFTLFSPMSKVHNAAHDTRHAVVAPCH